MLLRSFTKVQLIFSLLLLFILASTNLPAQQKKVLDHPDFAIWNRIQNIQISNDGDWVAYQVIPGEGDPTLNLYEVSTEKTFSFERSSGANFSADGKYLIYEVKPAKDSLDAQRRKKVDKDDLPGDTLAILKLDNRFVQKIPHLKSFKVPEEWSGWLTYQIDPQAAKSDTSSVKNGKKSKGKKYSGKNGYPLIIRELSSGSEDTIDYVQSFEIAKKAPIVLANTTGKDSTLRLGVYLFDCNSRATKSLSTRTGTYMKLALDETGSQVSFLADFDTTKVEIRPYELMFYSQSMDSAKTIARAGDQFMSNNWIINENQSPRFSEDGKRLFFGTSPKPILQDTSLLPEEIVNVEVWHYNEGPLYTQQNNRLDREKKRTYLASYTPASQVFRQIADLDLPETSHDRDANSPYIITYDDSQYEVASSWLGRTPRDAYITNIETGKRQLIGKGVNGFMRLSPGFKYAYWYSNPDSTYMVYSIARNQSLAITDDFKTPVYDELNDRPMDPSSYGVAGWTMNDESILIYDRYDIWSVDPNGKKPSQNLTKGRMDKNTYRYALLDRDEKYIDPEKKMILHVFNEETKESGYASLDLKTGQMEQLQMDDVAFDRRPFKAKNGNTIVFAKQTFVDFPDLHITTDEFNTYHRISEANPQQSEYNWGTIELFEWSAFDGQKLKGQLVKPENFDPSKKYPMIVNFYERSTDRVHQHPSTAPGRSTISYSFYASRGYVIFNPDIPYKVGYPGESAYNSVVSGTQALVREGFIDEKKIGIQGHSWGGYQIAHILTKTNIYACAESGAPVVNMISAYGGIRWGSGMSRMFQYEHTQSRIGGTLWEKPGLYLENSPIFNVDKIKTPVLILHNDEDSAVPWEQGIEFFVAMRRLGKPAWMLNYNGEPHWPVKLQNRKDFNIRLQQFFDHYLKDAPMPRWMIRGVPSIEKGIQQGYELSNQGKS